MIKHFYENLLKLTDGWHVDDLYQDNDNLEVIVSISHSTQEKYKCPKCNKAALIHDRRERTVRHLDTCDYKTLLKIKYPRIKCELCGRQAIEPPIAAISSRFTKEFEMRVVHLCYSSTVQKVARDLKPHWHVVCGIKARALGRGIKRLLQQNIGKLVTNITIDETSFQKHHNYTTIITDVDRSQVIAVLPDRTAETLKKWFATQTVADFSQLRSISIDMAPPYIKALKEYFPNGLRSSGCETTSPTWSALSGALRTELNLLQQDLSTALDALEVSTNSLTQWMNTSEVLKQRIGSLERFNEQIGERMMQRDMDLYWAYQDIDRLERQRLRFIIVIVSMGSVITVMTVVIICLIRIIRRRR